MTPHPDDVVTVAYLAGRSRPVTSLGALAAAAANKGGQRPFVTFYDGASGERTELGHATLRNWTSKTANLLAGDLGLAPGARVAVRLPAHWTALVTLLAAWRAGLVADLDGPLAGAGAAVVGEDRGRDDLAGADPARTVVVGRGLGGRLLGSAGGMLGFTEEVLACDDEFDDAEVAGDAPALAAGGTALTHGELLDAGAATVEALALAPGRRLLTVHPLDGPGGLLAILAALATGGSIVLVTGTAPAGVWRHAAAERCDLVAAPAGQRDALVAARPSGEAPPLRSLALTSEADRPAAVRAAP